ncbi:MAG: hypothetical protein ACPIOQ_73105, partial [Promethearchaeia archaeon]
SRMPAVPSLATPQRGPPTTPQSQTDALAFRALAAGPRPSRKGRADGLGRYHRAPPTATPLSDLLAHAAALPTISMAMPTRDFA